MRRLTISSTLALDSLLDGDEALLPVVDITRKEEKKKRKKGRKEKKKRREERN